MTRLRTTWHRLTEPSPAVTQPERRRESRLLMSLLVVISGLWALIFLSVPVVAVFRLAGERQHIVTVIRPLLLLGISPVLAASYLLARKGRHEWGSRILVMSASAAAFFDIVSTNDANVLSMPVIALVLCSVLLTPLDTLEAFAVTLGAYLILVFVLRQFTLWQVYGALIVVLVVAALSAINVVLRGRDLRQIESQAERLAAYQAELVEARKMDAVGRLSAGLAHELNNIMTAIRGYAEVIRRKPASSSPAYADRILEASERAVRLTDGLLSFGQQQLLHLVRIDINNLLRQHRAKLAAVLDRTTHLIVRAPPEAVVVSVDIDLFCRALQALLRQAEKHAREAGTIVIRTSVSAMDPANEFLLPGGRYCIISITDSGAPREAEMVDKLFEPFFTTGDFGTGNLELAAAWGIVRQCRGQIVVSSTETEGNRIQIALPCAPTGPDEMAGVTSG